ncbi:ADP-ribose pyrophosphatase [Actinomadura rubrobrunea]|uniref:ADP-ribose pyrophosphatase n=1 Tax=Actinomadura rubrobrunea TaxID=115335 RepID=A0A9W6UYD5_9ACTN|nr:NUDIX domain-containing protein [Actinomadura rubrobrunea]GLW66122.1 ADP-ribose pyrophosphatase [Actinomadura rubrobrunea]
MTAPREHPRQVVGVGALLLRPDGKVLIGHRIKQGEAASWCLPGGHVEPGETFEQAALREIAEETGIRAVTDARAFTVALRTDVEITHVTAGVVAETTNPQDQPTLLEPEVFDRWTWASPQSPPEPLFPATAALLHAWTNTPTPQGWNCYPIGALPDPATVPQNTR